MECFKVLLLLQSVFSMDPKLRKIPKGKNIGYNQKNG